MRGKQAGELTVPVLVELWGLLSVKVFNSVWIKKYPFRNGPILPVFAALRYFLNHKGIKAQRSTKKIRLIRKVALRVGWVVQDSEKKGHQESLKQSFLSRTEFTEGTQ